MSAPLPLSKRNERLNAPNVRHLLRKEHSPCLTLTRKFSTPSSPRRRHHVPILTTSPHPDPPIPHIHALDAIAPTTLPVIRNLDPLMKKTTLIPISSPQTALLGLCVRNFAEWPSLRSISPTLVQTLTLYLNAPNTLQSLRF